MHKNDKVLTQRVGSGWGSFYGFCAFTVGIEGYKKINNNRDQPPLGRADTITGRRGQKWV